MFTGYFIHVTDYNITAAQRSFGAHNTEAGCYIALGLIASTTPASHSYMTHQCDAYHPPRRLAGIVCVVFFIYALEVII